MFTINLDNLDDERKHFLHEFVNSLEDYIQHQKKSALNGWHIYFESNNIRYKGDKSYTAHHLPTDRFITLGSEYTGLMNTLHFINALVYDTVISDELSNLIIENIDLDKVHCYDCRYYDEYGVYFKCQLIEESMGTFRELNLNGEDYERRIACENYVKGTNLQFIDFNEYDISTDDWHNMNSVNDWSFFVYHDINENDDNVVDLYFVKHLPSTEIIFLGRDGNSRHGGKRNSIELYQAIIGQKDITRLGSCFSCKNYIKDENVCKANHLMIGKCSDYNDE